MMPTETFGQVGHSLQKRFNEGPWGLPQTNYGERGGLVVNVSDPDPEVGGSTQGGGGYSDILYIHRLG